MDAPGNDGNASMPEQVKQPNPWRKMMMMMIVSSILSGVSNLQYKFLTFFTAQNVLRLPLNFKVVFCISRYLNLRPLVMLGQLHSVAD